LKFAVCDFLRDAPLMIAKGNNNVIIVQ